jgi:hypothetical protein
MELFLSFSNCLLSSSLRNKGFFSGDVWALEAEFCWLFDELVVEELSITISEMFRRWNCIARGLSTFDGDCSALWPIVW